MLLISLLFVALFVAGSAGAVVLASRARPAFASVPVTTRPAALRAIRADADADVERMVHMREAAARVIRASPKP
jgi:hypothetical protein